MALPRSSQVDAAALSLDGRLHRRQRPSRYPHLLGPDVDGAGRDGRQRRNAADQAVGRLVQSAVAAADEHQRQPLLRRPRRQLRRPSRRAGLLPVHLPALSPQPAVRLVQPLAGGEVVGHRVDDDQRLSAGVGAHGEILVARR